MSATGQPAPLSNLFMVPGYQDATGLRWANSVYQDQLVAQRHDFVSGHFANGIPSQLFQTVLRWDLSAVVGGPFNANERVVGGTSNAVGIIEITASPALIRTLRGAFQSGETITGIGVSAAASGATATITANAAINGQVTTASSVGQIISGTSATNSLALEARGLVHFAGGHEVSGYFTAAFSASGTVAGVSQFIGVFTRGGSEGYAIGYMDTGFGFLSRRSGTGTFYAQSTWNLDPMNGFGPSRMTLDPTKLNYYGIKTGFGAGVVLYVLGTDLQWYPVHRVSSVNVGLTAGILDPHLTIRAEIVKTSGAGVATIYTTCWNAFTGGPRTTDFADQRHGAFTLPLTTYNTGATRCMVTVLNKLTLNGAPNRTRAYLSFTTCASDASAANHATITIRKNCGVVGSNPYTDVDTLNSALAYSTAASGGFATTGGVQIPLSVPGQAGVNIQFPENQFITIEPGETLTLVVDTTNNQQLQLGLRFIEGI